MEVREEWERFMETGKISDYLKCVEAENAEELAVNENVNFRRNSDNGTPSRRN